jgi:hypothetical protein
MAEEIDDVEVWERARARMERALSQVEPGSWLARRMRARKAGDLEGLLGDARLMWCAAPEGWVARSMSPVTDLIEYLEGAIAKRLEATILLVAARIAREAYGDEP